MAHAKHKEEKMPHKKEEHSHAHHHKMVKHHLAELSKMAKMGAHHHHKEK